MEVYTHHDLVYRQTLVQVFRKEVTHKIVISSFTSSHPIQLSQFPKPVGARTTFTNVELRLQTRLIKYREHSIYIPIQLPSYTPWNPNRIPNMASQSVAKVAQAANRVIPVHKVFIYLSIQLFNLDPSPFPHLRPQPQIQLQPF